MIFVRLGLLWSSAAKAKSDIIFYLYKVHCTVFYEMQCISYTLDTTKTKFFLQGKLDISKRHVHSLRDGDLYNPVGISEIVSAAKILLEASQTNLSPGTSYRI